MRVLTVTSLYPNEAIRIDHPRYAMIPKIGMQSQPIFYHRALKRAAAKLIEETGPFDMIDAHYFYPDGVAAAKLAEELGIPFTCTARGTDINHIPSVSDFGRQAVLDTARRASASITVCEALRQEMVDLGADGMKIHTLRNGVDLESFHTPTVSREGLKATYGVPVDAPLVVSVGGLVERKGHHLTIDAVAGLKNVHLLIAGQGPERDALQARIEGLEVEDRVKLVGAVPHKELSDFYGAADVSVLASSREGWANVLLESMACGTPVVATSVWGTPEVVATPEAGLLATERDADTIRFQIRSLLKRLPDRAATRAYAERFSWDDTVDGVIDVFKNVVAGHIARRSS